jgi:hypothetical protein
MPLGACVYHICMCTYIHTRTQNTPKRIFTYIYIPSSLDTRSDTHTYTHTLCMCIYMSFPLHDACQTQTTPECFMCVSSFAREEYACLCLSRFVCVCMYVCQCTYKNAHARGSLSASTYDRAALTACYAQLPLMTKPLLLMLEAPYQLPLMTQPP